MVTITLVELRGEEGALTKRTQMHCECGLEEVIEYPDAYRYASVHLVEVHNGDGGIRIGRPFDAVPVEG